MEPATTTAVDTANALAEIDRSGASFANVNPHWWIGKDDKGYWCDYSYCGDIDCDCYQHDTGLTREEILEHHPDGEWIKQNS